MSESISGKLVLAEGSRIIDALLAAHKSCISGASSPGLFAAGSYAALAALFAMMHKEMLAREVPEQTLHDIRQIASHYELSMTSVAGPGMVRA